VRGDVLRDPLRVALDSADVLRRERVEEVEAEEVEAALVRGPAPLHRLAVFTEYRHLDPAEVQVEAGAPDHVCDIQHAAVLEGRKTVPYADRLRSAGDAGGVQIPRLHPDARCALRQYRWPDLPPERGPQRQHVREDELEDRVHKTRPASLDPDGDLALVPAGEPRAVGRRHIHCDVRPGIPGADEKNAARLEGRRMQVPARLQLRGTRTEHGGDLGQGGRRVEPGCDDDVFRLEPPIARIGDEPISVLRETVDLGAQLNGQLESI